MYPGKLLRLLQPGKTFTKISIFLPQQPVFPVQIPALRFQLLQTLLQPEEWARKASFSVLQS